MRGRSSSGWRARAIIRTRAKLPCKAGEVRMGESPRTLASALIFICIATGISSTIDLGKKDTALFTTLAEGRLHSDDDRHGNCAHQIADEVWESDGNQTTQCAEEDIPVVSTPRELEANVQASTAVGGCGHG